MSNVTSTSASGETYRTAVAEDLRQAKPNSDCRKSKADRTTVSKPRFEIDISSCPSTYYLMDLTSSATRWEERR